VDRAGLDVALEAGIPVGGYCPKGRLSEDGTVPECCSLTELTRGARRHDRHYKKEGVVSPTLLKGKTGT
jgi:hypothetical protein